MPKKTKYKNPDASRCKRIPVNKSKSNLKKRVSSPKVGSKSTKKESNSNISSASHGGSKISHDDRSKVSHVDSKFSDKASVYSLRHANLPKSHRSKYVAAGSKLNQSAPPSPSTAHFSINTFAPMKNVKVIRKQGQESFHQADMRSLQMKSALKDRSGIMSISRVSAPSATGSRKFVHSGGSISIASVSNRGGHGEERKNGFSTKCIGLVALVISVSIVTIAVVAYFLAMDLGQVIASSVLNVTFGPSSKYFTKGSTSVSSGPTTRTSSRTTRFAASSTISFSATTVTSTESSTSKTTESKETATFVSASTTSDKTISTSFVKSTTRSYAIPIPTVPIDNATKITWALETPSTPVNTTITTVVIPSSSLSSTSKGITKSISSSIIEKTIELAVLSPSEMVTGSISTSTSAKKSYLSSSSTSTLAMKLELSSTSTSPSTSAKRIKQTADETYYIITSDGHINGKTRHIHHTY